MNMKYKQLHLDKIIKFSVWRTNFGRQWFWQVKCFGRIVSGGGNTWMSVISKNLRDDLPNQEKNSY